jgi:hypothetical protein
LLVAAPSDAHGPCGCTFPQVARPGQQIRTGIAYKVIWNPSRSDFRRQSTPRDLVSGYREDAPTAVVLRRSQKRPLRRAPFRIPLATPPGLYFVLVFDGGEGGSHTTWDYVQVPGRPQQPHNSDDLDELALVLAAAAGAAVAALVTALAMRRRRR